MSKIADCIESIERNAFQRTQRVQRHCGTCKYHQHEDVDDGWVCVNNDSVNFTEWTEYNDSCEDWEEREK